MLVVYNEDTGLVVDITIPAKPPERDKNGKLKKELLARDVNPEYGENDSLVCIEVPDDASMLEVKHRLSVKDDEYLVVLPEKVLVVQPVAENVPTTDDGRFRVSRKSKFRIKVSFSDDQGGKYKPTGTLEMLPSRGVIDPAFVELKGDKDHHEFTYLAVNETVKVSVKCRLKGFLTGRVKLVLL